MGPSIVAAGVGFDDLLGWLVDPAHAWFGFPVLAVMLLAGTYVAVMSFWSRKSRERLAGFGGQHGLAVFDGDKATGTWHGVDVVVEVLDGSTDGPVFRPLLLVVLNPAMSLVAPFVLVGASMWRAYALWRWGRRLTPRPLVRARAFGCSVSCTPRSQRTLVERAGVATGDPGFDAEVHVRGFPEDVAAVLGPEQRRKVRAMLADGHRVESGRVVVLPDSDEPEAMVAALDLAVSLARDLGDPHRGALGLVARAQGDDLPHVRARALDALSDLYGRAHTTQAAVVGVLQRAAVAVDDADALAAALGTDPVVTRAAAYRLAKIGRAVHVPALQAVQGTGGTTLDELVEHAVLSIQARVGPETLGRLTAVAVGDAQGGLSVVAPDVRGALSVERTKY